MTPQVVPITHSVIDWNNYLKIVQRAIGTSITKSLDKAGMTPGSIPAFLFTLADLKQHPPTILRDSSSLLRHVSVSFLAIIDSDSLIEFLELGTLSILTRETIKPEITILILSGNLDQWRSAVIEGCSLESPFQIRSVFDQCLIHFEKAGLGNLWFHYKKRTMSDGTFLLLEKK